jgi:hypothetical protein
MMEIGIGVLFAILFVSAYLLVKKLLGGDDGGQPRRPELGSHPTVNSRRVTAKTPPLFLKTGEMSEHHSKTRGREK